MSAFAVAELEVTSRCADAFALFTDFTRWGEWMPRTFSPVTGPTRALQLGDKFKVRVGSLPIALEVIRLRAGAEICWRGGSRWVMRGDHAFLFTEANGKTRIRSQETLSGLLTVSALGGRVQGAAAREAQAMLARFSDYLARQTR
jgi:hypothetical protein